MAAAVTGISPSPRKSSFVASATDRLYLWGGVEDTEPNILHIYSINTETWMREFTKGPHPPAGLHYGGCSLAGQHIYLYGGYYGSFLSGLSRSGSLYQLNTDNWSWSEISNCSAGGPGRKIGCGMITYEDHLVVVGGNYSSNEEPDSKQPGSRYKRGYTNELHCYSLTTGLWSSPSVKGSRPPPCSGFSLTMFDEEHAVMFGGYSPGSGNSADAYVLHVPTMSWTCLPHKDGDPRPEERRKHIAVCLGYGKKVLFSGGRNGGTVLNDTWLLDPQSGRWEEVPVYNKKLVQRYHHSAALYTISPECIEVVLFGGVQELENISDTTVLRFELHHTHSSDKKSWGLTDIASHAELGSSKRLEDKGRIMESFGTHYTDGVDERERTLQQQVTKLEIRPQESDRRAEESHYKMSERDD